MSNTFPHGYALLIGVGESAVPNWSLQVTVKDMLALKSVLADPHFCAYDKDKIRLLHDAEATRQNILEGLAWLKEQAQHDPQATMIIYYSGHGWLEQNSNRYYLLQHDVDIDHLADTALDAETFTAHLHQIPAQRLLVVIDSCHAEGMAAAKHQLPSGFSSHAMPEHLIKTLSQGKGRVAFTSSLGKELSWIRPDLDMSVYTYHLIEALQGKGNQAGDTAVRISDLMGYLSKKVPESVRHFYKTEQTPFFDMTSGNFPLAICPNQITTEELADLEEPEGQVPLNSPFYMERPPIEADCYHAIIRPYALIRIKAPRQMGKSSLMTRVLHHAEQQGYRTAALSFQQADNARLADLDKFLQWFCAGVTRKLKLPTHKVADLWDDFLGSKDNSSEYFEKELLAEFTTPLVLGLDDVDRIFEYQEIASDFFGLLRTWHEQSKNNDIWKKLRLVIVHSKEVYIPLNINQSPFNVGTAVELSEFTLAQVQELAQRHQLDWTDAQCEQLMNIVGGHPYLIREALYQIAHDKMTLAQLLKKAPTEEGPYAEHLRRHLRNLEQDEQLRAAIKKVVAEKKPIEIGSTEAFKLHSMGLIKLQGDAVMPLCHLYRDYFSKRL